MTETSSDIPNVDPEAKDYTYYNNKPKAVKDVIVDTDIAKNEETASNYVLSALFIGNSEYTKIVDVRLLDSEYEEQRDRIIDSVSKWAKSQNGARFRCIGLFEYDNNEVILNQEIFARHAIAFKFEKD